MTARRAPRPDGDATRLLLIETAGQVFAERGYAEATEGASHTICHGIVLQMREREWTTGQKT